MARTVTVDWNDPPSKFLRRAEKGAKEGIVTALRVHHRKFTPKHFVPSAVRRYGYSKRTKRYQLQKAKYRGHQNPLMDSGETRMRVRRKADVTARRRKEELEGNLRLGVPKYFFMHPHAKKTGSFIDKPRELSATTSSEEEVMAEGIRRRMLRRIGENPERHVIRFS